MWGVKIVTEPKELYQAVICMQDNCPWDGVCANHTTAGDFRSEGGSRPILSLRSGEVHCETFHSPGDGYEHHEQPVNTAPSSKDQWGNAIVCWRELIEETDSFQI